MPMTVDSKPIIAAVGAPSKSASCSVPDSEPRIDKLVSPAYTEEMKARHKAGTVDVTVYLEPNGSVAKAFVVRSMGDPLFDAATYTAAMETTYTPEVRSCTYLAGSYVFRAVYRAVPNGQAANAPAGPPAFPPLPVKTFGPVPYATDATDAPAASAAPAPPAHANRRGHAVPAAGATPSAVPSPDPSPSNAPH